MFCVSLLVCNTNALVLLFLIGLVGGFFFVLVFFFQAEDGIRDLVRSRGLGDVYKRQAFCSSTS